MKNIPQVVYGLFRSGAVSCKRTGSQNEKGENDMKTGDKIRALRKGKKLTQEQLAEYLNVSAQAVSKWETGDSLR